ncbi:MAG: hypothetical protein VW685_04185, partial [Ilumatobacter sp.]
MLGGLLVFWLVLGDELSREFDEDAASEQSLWDEREVELGAWLAVNSTSDTRFLLTARSSLDEVSVDLRVGVGEIRVLLGDGPQHVVEFECSTMFSPSDQASSADSRRLCVYVTALRVDAPA